MICILSQEKIFIFVHFWLFRCCKGVAAAPRAAPQSNSACNESSSAVVVGGRRLPASLIEDPGTGLVGGQLDWEEVLVKFVLSGRKV